jgi:2-polyprenyl-6-methoxyphenol hydroxylase-like FAD-dependent oxidoreductase
MADILIAGAGLGGLTAALALIQQYGPASSVVSEP